MICINTCTHTYDVYVYVYIFRIEAQLCQQKACELAEKEERVQAACKGSLQRLQQHGGTPLTYEGYTTASLRAPGLLYT
jgi:hypothetical protein